MDDFFCVLEGGERMKKGIILIVSFVILMTIVGFGKSNLPTVGIIQYANHPALDLANEGFVDALADNGFVDQENIQIAYKSAQNDPTMTETIASSLVNNGSSLIYAIATPAAQSVANRTSEIPVVVSAVTDPSAVGLVESNEKPNTNVTGMSDLTPIDDQIDLLTQLIPDAKTVAILYSSSEENSRIQAGIAKESLTKRGIEYKDTTVSDLTQIQQVTQSLAGKVDAIYVPTDSMMAEGISTVTSVATENHIPTIVAERAHVEGGGMATYGISYYKLGYQAGLQAVDILTGKSQPQDMPISYLQLEDFELVINEKTTKQLGITIPSEILEKADIISE